MHTQFEIVLNEANGLPVSLRKMSPDALDSFLLVVSSLKDIATSLINTDEITFGISEGSAKAILVAEKNHLSVVKQEIDTAIKGKSSDKDVTTKLRSIQEQFKRKGFNYTLIYKDEKGINYSIHDNIIRAKQIRLKQRNNYEYRIEIKQGILNQIGGKLPNYHFNYGADNKITISCTHEEAKSVNQYLYENVIALVLCKVWISEDKNNEYSHISLIDNNLYAFLLNFFTIYYSKQDLVDRLDIFYSTITNADKKEKKLKLLNYLLLAFNYKEAHLSEIKTLLVISKSLKDEPTIKESRSKLYDTYLLLKSQINT